MSTEATKVYFIEKQRAERAAKERGEMETIKHGPRLWEKRWRSGTTQCSLYFDPLAKIHIECVD